jgi:hypothetical protein
MHSQQQPNPGYFAKVLDISSTPRPATSHQPANASPASNIAESQTHTNPDANSKNELRDRIAGMRQAMGTIELNMMALRGILPNLQPQMGALETAVKKLKTNICKIDLVLRERMEAGGKI